MEHQNVALYFLRVDYVGGRLQYVGEMTFQAQFLYSQRQSLNCDTGSEQEFSHLNAVTKLDTMST